MVSSRARKGRSLGTRLNDLDQRTASAEAKARTPDVDAEDIENRLVSLEATVEYATSTTYREEQEGMADTGWVDVTISSGFAQQGSTPPQVRRIGRQVWIRGGWNNTGMAISTTYAAIGTIPAEFRPPQTVIFAPGMATGANTGVIRIEPNGNIELRTGPSLSAYYMPANNWLTD